MFSLRQIVEGFRDLGTPVQRPVLPLGDALAGLVPKVRPRFRYETRALNQVGNCPVFRPLAGLYALSLVVDFPDGELDVGPRELAAWGGSGAGGWWRSTDGRKPSWIDATARRAGPWP